MPVNADVRDPFSDPIMSNAADGSILSLWNPSSIAVIGASESQGSFGERAIRYLRKLQFAGSIFPVNPNYETVSGLICYSSVESIPATVDCAVIALSRTKMTGLFADLAEKNCSLAVVMGAGYSEEGAEGAAYEKELRKEAARVGIRILGPNTTGAVNVTAGIALGASSLMDHPKLQSGSVALVCQSGSLAASVGDQLLASGIGLSFAFGIGNAVDVKAAELLSMLAMDPRTSIVVAVLEGIDDPDDFAIAARQLSDKGKRLVVVKSGRSDTGSRIASNHSGAMVGSWEAFRSLAEGAGALVADRVEMAVDVVRLLSTGFTPEAGARLHAVTLSGALSGLLADEAARVGLPLLEPPDGGPLEGLLRRFGYSAPTNPLDYGQVPRSEGGRGALRELWSEILADASTTSLFVVASITHHLRYMAQIVSDLRDQPTPIIGYVAEGALIDEFAESMEESGIVMFRDLRRAVEAIDAIRRWPESVPTEFAVPDVSAPATATETLSRLVDRPTEANTAAYLKVFGLDFPRSALAHDLHDFEHIDLDLPVVLKVSSAVVTHKASAGLVHMPLRDRESVVAAFESCRVRAREAGVWEGEALVQELVDLGSGVELLCAVRDDTEAGLVLVLGLGGSLAEVVKLVTVSQLPRTADECRATLGRNSLIASIDSAVGSVGLTDRLTTPIMAMADAARFARELVAEFEVNPIVVFRDGRATVALDAVAVLRSRVPPTGASSPAQATSVLNGHD